MIKTIEQYKARGMKPEMMNVGFPLYAKWFAPTVVPTGCTPDGLGCQFAPNSFENTQGADTNRSGTWTFNEAMMSDKYLGTELWPNIQSLAQSSWNAVKSAGKDDAANGATSAWDGKVFWTWMSAQNFGDSCKAVLPDVGGVMIW